MASIAFDNITTSSITVGLSGLDPTWNGAKRTAYWTCTGKNYNKSSSRGIDNNVTDGGWVTFPGMQSGTTYYFEVEVIANNITLFSDSASKSTIEESLQNPEITSYSASIYDLMNKQVFCKVGVSNPDRVSYDVDIYANDRNSTSGGTYLGLFSSSSDDMSHTNVFELYKNKIYYIYFVLKVGSKVIETTSTIKLDFSLPEPTVTIDTISQNPGVSTANVYWSTTNLDSVNNAKFTIQARINSESTWYNKATNLSSNTTNYTISFDRNGTYYVRIKLTGDNIKTTYSDEKSIYIYIQVPASWSWSYNASDAFSNKGSIKNLTRTEWNNFIDRVNTAISYYNFYNPNDKKNLISSTSKMQDDKILYASSFRDIINKLNQLSSVNINTNNIQTGEIIYGNYFNYLSQALNNYIDSI